MNLDYLRTQISCKKEIINTQNIKKKSLWLCLSVQLNTVNISKYQYISYALISVLITARMVHGCIILQLLWMLKVIVKSLVHHRDKHVSLNKLFSCCAIIWLVLHS